MNTQAQAKPQPKARLVALEPTEYPELETDAQVFASFCENFTYAAGDGSAPPLQRDFVMDFYVPTQMPTGEWSCRLVYDGHEQLHKRIYGEDSLQAVRLALRAGGQILGALAGQGWLLSEKPQYMDHDFFMHYLG